MSLIIVSNSQYWTATLTGWVQYNLIHSRPISRQTALDQIRLGSQEDFISCWVRGLHRHILSRKEENGHFLRRNKHIISLTYHATWHLGGSKTGSFNPTTFLPSLWQDDKACDGPISTPKHDLLVRNPTGGPRDRPNPSGQTMPRQLGVGRVWLNKWRGVGRCD